MIGEVADELDLPAHVLRFWETKFPRLKPVKRSGGRRYYRPEDIQLLRSIRQWLYQDGYTIRGVQQLLESNAPAMAMSGEDPNVASPVTAATPDANAGAGLGAEMASGSEADAAAPLAAAPPPVREHRPEFPAPVTRAELEEIRRDLRQARALLDGLLRPSEKS
jgi:DNA-binding transcriptional MerR regulator